MNRRKRIKTFKLLIIRALLVFWIAGIFYVSLTSSPQKDFPLCVSLGPLALHFIAFFVLFILFYLSFVVFEDKIILRMGSFFGLTVSVSLIKEFAQFFVKGRTFSFEDILVDAGSALIAAVIIGMAERRKTWLRHQL